MPKEAAKATRKRDGLHPRQKSGTLGVGTVVEEKHDNEKGVSAAVEGRSRVSDLLSSDACLEVVQKVCW